MATAPENPFWEFSLNAYERSGVAESCITLQDRHGLDVNLLLFAAWSGRCGHSLSAAELALLRACSSDWQAAVVRPLRGVRRWLKDQKQLPESLGEGLREQVKGLELQGEMLEQLLLYEELPIDEADPDPRLAAANMRLYLEVYTAEPDDADLADLAVVLRGACPEVTPLEAIWSLGN